MSGKTTTVQVLSQHELPEEVEQLTRTIISDVSLLGDIEDEVVGALADLLTASVDCPGMRAVASVVPKERYLDFYFLVNQREVDKRSNPADALEEQFIRLLSAAGGKIGIQSLFVSIGETQLLDALEEIATQCSFDKVRLGVAWA